MSYKIEKGIPAPDKSERGEKSHVLKSLEVGDSFECTKSDSLSFRSLWMTLGPKKFSSKKQDNGQIRIWRTA